VDARTDEKKHQLDEAPEVEAREGRERLKLEWVGLDRAPRSCAAIIGPK